MTKRILSLLLVSCMILSAAALAGDRIFHHLNALSAAEKDNHGKNRYYNQIAKDR